MKNTSSSFLPFRPKELLLPALLGASLPLAWLLFIILTKGDLFETWMYYPLIIIPLGGSAGGIFFFLMGFKWFPKGNQKLVAVIFSTILYFVAIWISAVMAFAVTGHWN
ncbi:hypothetical protein [Algoriphagus hitonicola]|uniref:Potassium transporter KefB n=1 Tax=Algoriphagus hitonicola TaxID=435880 RepID=A0A1I2SU18_9BACT|nr:hypothetical protein [Algoriphagus hitonicola]SFG56088.1 hypothetical protein SAMN04487988_10560 [Algoriphagus hitonicola]